MSSDENDLREVVLSFLSTLPAAIKPGLLQFIVLYCAGIRPDLDGRDELEILRGFLMDEVFYKSFGAAVSVVSMVDYLLAERTSRFEQTKKIKTEVVKQFPDMEARLLALPLEQKYYQQSLAAWKLLRSSELSAGGIRILEDKLITPPE